MTQRQVHFFAVFFTKYFNQWFNMMLPGPQFKIGSTVPHVIRFVEPYTMSKTQFETYSVATVAEGRVTR